MSDVHLLLKDLQLGYHLMGGGNWLSGNVALLAWNLASTMVPSIFLRLGSFFRQ